jgi:hypothetical protein
VYRDTNEFSPGRGQYGSGLPVTCDDVEMTLMGVTINPKLPRDHAELVTSILYHLVKDYSKMGMVDEGSSVGNKR